MDKSFAAIEGSNIWGGVEAFVATVKNLPQLSGKFDTFFEQTNLFFPWQTFVTNLFGPESCLDVSEVLDRVFDLQIANLEGTKSREELRQEKKKLDSELFTAQREARVANDALAEKQREIDTLKAQGKSFSNAEDVGEGLVTLAVGGLFAWGGYKAYKKGGWKAVASYAKSFADYPGGSSMTPNFGGWSGRGASTFPKIPH